jgi:hypothetical protein
MRSCTGHLFTFRIPCTPLVHRIFTADTRHGNPIFRPLATSY